MQSNFHTPKLIELLAIIRPPSLNFEDDVRRLKLRKLVEISSSYTI